MSNFNLLLSLYSLFIVLCIQSGSVEGISGGIIALPRQFNFMVSIWANDEYICSGAIIDEEYIISAAQCFIDRNNVFINKKFTILVGTTDLSTLSPTAKWFEVSAIYVPLEYKRSDADPLTVGYKEKGDVALVQVTTKFDMEESSKLLFPKRSARSFLKYNDEEPYLIGYGSSSYQQATETNQYKLKFAQTTVNHKRWCNKLYPFEFNDKQLCAQMKQDIHSNTGVVGSCHGDIGSPLVMNQNTIIGVLIHHPANCDELATAGLYSRVTTYVPFVNKIIQDRKHTHVWARVAFYQETSSGTGSLMELNVVI